MNGSHAKAKTNLEEKWNSETKLELSHSLFSHEILVMFGNGQTTLNIMPRKFIDFLLLYSRVVLGMNCVYEKIPQIVKINMEDFAEIEGIFVSLSHPSLCLPPPSHTHTHTALVFWCFFLHYSSPFHFSS